MIKSTIIKEFLMQNNFCYDIIRSTREVEFLLGLMTNCFILSALFIRTKSLWICVMTHSLINVFPQLAMGGNQYVSYICKIIILIMAVVLSIRKQNKRETDVSAL